MKIDFMWSFYEFIFISYIYNEVKVLLKVKNFLIEIKVNINEFYVYEIKVELKCI